MTYKKQATSKLFYGKWPYRIRCHVDGSWRIKRTGVAETLKFCFDKNNGSIGWDIKRRQVDKPRLLKFTRSLIPFLDKELQVRAEQSIFSIYCKDAELYKAIIKELMPYITEICEPASDLEFDYITSNSAKKVIRNALPHQKYRYKVYFKSECNANTKVQFESWSHNYGDKIKIPRSTATWFTQGWQQSPYILVEDSSTLAMIGLFMGHNVNKVEEFILISSINTCLDQEQVCQHSVSA